MPFYPAKQFKYANINATSKGASNTIIEAVAGSKIIVLGYLLTTTKPGIHSFKGESELAKINVLAQTPVDFVGSMECPAFECAKGKALTLTTVAEGEASGHIVYVLD